MIVLDELAIKKSLRYPALIEAMEQALTDFSSGRVTQPVRQILNAGAGLFGVMPAVYRDIMGAKLVTLFPDNKALPTHQAAILVFSASTGEPLACVDGRLITEMRTAAVSAVAARALAPKDAKVLALVGSGVQARAHIDALRHVHRFERILIWSRNPERARKLAETAAAEVRGNVAEAAREADVVVTATNSQAPLLNGEWLKPRALVIAVGAVGAKNRELSANVFDDAFVVVDSRDAARVEAGDILMAGAGIDAEIGDVLAGVIPARRRAERTVFKSLGLAVEDLAAAALVLEICAARGKAVS